MVWADAIESPLDPLPRLSARLDNTVLLKRLDLQPVFSFRLRGALYKIANLSGDRSRGAASYALRQFPGRVEARRQRGRGSRVI